MHVTVTKKQRGRLRVRRGGNNVDLESAHSRPTPPATAPPRILVSSRSGPSSIHLPLPLLQPFISPWTLTLACRLRSAAKTSTASITTISTNFHHEPKTRRVIKGARQAPTVPPVLPFAPLPYLPSGHLWIPRPSTRPCLHSIGQQQLQGNNTPTHTTSSSNRTHSASETRPRKVHTSRACYFFFPRTPLPPVRPCPVITPPSRLRRVNASSIRVTAIALTLLTCQHGRVR